MFLAFFSTDLRILGVIGILNFWLELRLFDAQGGKGRKTCCVQIVEPTDK